MAMIQRVGAGPVRALARVCGRHRARLQLLALMLVAAGYCLLLATTALDPPPPTPPFPMAPATPASSANVSAQRRIQAQLPAPQTARAAGLSSFDTAEGSEGADVGGDDLEEVDLQALDVEMEARRRTVWETCAARGLHHTGVANAWEFFIDAKHSLVWCNVFKAASTAWLYNFNLLAGYKESYLRRSLKPPLALARARYPRPTTQQLAAALPDSLSFLIVREPYERLLSAYRNKLEGMRNRFYRKLAREVAAKYRKDDSASAPRHDVMPSTLQPGPTFPQFVDYVIDAGLMAENPHFDEHWAPIYRFCTPCHVNFTVVAKMETLAKDQEYIIHRAGLEVELLRRKEPPRRVVNRARDGRATADLVAKYYRQLTRTQLEQLQRIYGVDFEMFGYNVSKYFDLISIN